MSQPFIFIGTHRIKAGKAEAYKRYVSDFVRFIEEQEPQLRLFRFYFDDADEHVVVVQVHPDAESMALHMQIAQQHIGDAYREYLDETVSIQIFGEPTPDVLATMKSLAGEGVPVTMNRPSYGFERLPQPAATA